MARPTSARRFSPTISATLVKWRHLARIHSRAELNGRAERRRRGKAALRPNRETVEIDVASCLFRALLERIEAFKHRTLGADEAEYHAFVFWHET
jgi:hypothetical protein